MKPNTYFFSHAVFLLFISSSCDGAVLDQSQTTFSATVSGFGSGNERAQTFEVGLAGTLDSFRVHIHTTILGAADLSYGIYPTTSGIPDEVALTTGTVTGLGASYSGYVTVDVSGAGIEVSPGDVLAIGIGNDAAVEDEETWYWSLGRSDVEDYYEDGTFFARLADEPGFETWTENPVSSFNYDGVFETFVSIPEPSTGLFVGGCLGAFALRRRKTGH